MIRLLSICNRFTLLQNNKSLHRTKRDRLSSIDSVNSVVGIRIKVFLITWLCHRIFVGNDLMFCLDVAVSNNLRKAFLLLN